VGAWRCVFSRDLLGERTVVADRRAADKHGGRHGSALDGGDETSSRVDAAVLNGRFLLERPPLAADRFAGEVDDRVGAVDLACPRPGSAVGNPLNEPGAGVLSGSAGAAAENDDIVAFPRESVRERVSEKSTAAGDDDFHDARICL